MIGIVDYGLGNIRAFLNIYRILNIPVKIASTPELLEDCSKIILPGVGSFDWAINKLNKSGLRPTLEKLVLVNHIPVLGICVGMQIMAQESDEGVLPGLGWIEGKVKKLTTNKQLSEKDNSRNLILPHMGWNNLKAQYNSNLLLDIKDDYFYFIHSYYFHLNKEEMCLSKSNYNIDFSSAINTNNIYAVQFHPEKSHMAGIKLLKNFSQI